MSASHDHVPRHRVRNINPVRARLLQVFGPADSWDNPLAGTKYDPAIRQHEEQTRRGEKQARRAERRRARDLHRVVSEPETDHHTPDEV